MTDHITLYFEQGIITQAIVAWHSSLTDKRETQPLENKIENTEVMQTHFESMLRYMGEQESFLKMMNETSEIYKEAAEYIEENGMLIYGYSGIAKKEELLKMNEWSEIYAIEVSELR